MNLSKVVLSGRNSKEMPSIFAKQRHYLDKPMAGNNSRPSDHNTSKLTMKKIKRGESSLYSRPSQPNLNIYLAE